MTLNKALLGTRHKVSGPQNADVRIKEYIMQWVPPRRRQHYDEPPLLQPVFHAMEKQLPNLPRYGKHISTVWKTGCGPPPTPVVMDDKPPSSPHPGMNYKFPNNALHRTSHKVRRPVKADVGTRET